jgi:hypothetical protein
MVFGERHRVAHFVEVDFGANTAIEADRGVGPLGSRCSRHDRPPGDFPGERECRVIAPDEGNTS